MSEEAPKTNKPVTKLEEITAKIGEDDALPDDALEQVVGGDVQIGQRGSNGQQ
jgi:hypothetical protein